jgi:hypothetical protein
MPRQKMFQVRSALVGDKPPDLMAESWQIAIQIF